MEIVFDKTIENNSGCCFILHRNGWCEKKKETYTIDYHYGLTIQRDGYLRQILPLMCFVHTQSDYKCLQDNKTTPKQLMEFFKIPSDIKEKYIVKDIDPWLCFTENLDLVLYFGEDKPILKEKTVKSNTKHRLTWAHYSKHRLDGTPATYKYWKVKDESQLLIFTIWLSDLKYIFPEMEYQFDDNWAFRENPKLPELYLNQPFKASRVYDYSDDEKKNILEEERKIQEEKERKQQELEERKNTPGYCRFCGAEHAEYIPFEEMWLCQDCYYSLKM